MIVHTRIIFRCHSHDIHSIDGFFELGSIVHTRDREISIGKETISFRVFKNEFLYAKVNKVQMNYAQYVFILQGILHTHLKK